MNFFPCSSAATTAVDNIRCLSDFSTQGDPVLCGVVAMGHGGAWGGIVASGVKVPMWVW